MHALTGRSAVRRMGREAVEHCTAERKWPKTILQRIWARLCGDDAPASCIDGAARVATLKTERDRLSATLALLTDELAVCQANCQTLEATLSAAMAHLAECAERDAPPAAALPSLRRGSGASESVIVASRYQFVPIAPAQKALGRANK